MNLDDYPSWQCKHSTHENVQIFYDSAKDKRPLLHVHKHSKECLQHHTSDSYHRRERDDINECIFCDAYKLISPIKKQWESSPFSRAGLEEHVAQHMEDVALLVLQWLPIDEQPPREMLPYELPREMR